MYKLSYKKIKRIKEGTILRIEFSLNNYFIKILANNEEDFYFIYLDGPKKNTKIFLRWVVDSNSSTVCYLVNDYGTFMPVKLNLFTVKTLTKYQMINS